MNPVFNKGLFQLNGEKTLLTHNNNLRGHKKVYVSYGSWSSGRHEPSFCFSICGLRFFLRVTVTMISKRFAKMGIIVHYRI